MIFGKTPAIVFKALTFNVLLLNSTVSIYFYLQSSELNKIFIFVKQYFFLTFSLVKIRGRLMFGFM
jgi:hypothetical protein